MPPTEVGGIFTSLKRPFYFLMRFLIVRQILSDPQIFIIAQIFIIVTQIPAIIRTKKIFKNFLRFLQQFGRNDLLYR